MVKTRALKTDELFARAERVRREARMLTRQFQALRELRVLDRDIRTVTRKLVLTMRMFATPQTAGGLNHLLAEAEELLSPPRASSGKNTLS
jgi:hypothetical protein